MRGARLSLPWLRDHFHHSLVEGEDSPEYTEQYARAYILMLIGVGDRRYLHSCTKNYARLLFILPKKLVEHAFSSSFGHDPDFQIVCTPYTGVVVPEFSTRGAEVWRALVPMILFHIVETNDIWHVIHMDYINRWDTRRDRIQQGRPLVSPLTSTSDYMKWYRRITRRWIGRSSATLGRVISQPAPPSQTLVQPPPEEVEQGGGRARRRRTGLAANCTRLHDDEPSSSSSHGTQSSTLASTGPPPQPPQQHFPKHPFPYPRYIVYPIPHPHTGATGKFIKQHCLPTISIPIPSISFHRRHHHLEFDFF
ncbi:hypothetical protein PIB30_021323 [Stylosanthes scabra]|uniref:Serine/threonine-protein phosphatase 7 long form-like n=1 Tax=Stylosanthes scabra TaxID=79078 RepID=A0ABU6Z6A5_9FABA|nr:hypothetical protein [Stylosanthes scabra]